MRDLSEAQIRYLARVASQMRAGVTTEIVIKIHQGGVREYRESRTFAPADLLACDLELAEYGDMR